MFPESSLPTEHAQSPAHSSSPFPQPGEQPRAVSETGGLITSPVPSTEIGLLGRACFPRPSPPASHGSDTQGECLQLRNEFSGPLSASVLICALKDQGT